MTLSEHTLTTLGMMGDISPIFLGLIAGAGLTFVTRRSQSAQSSDRALERPYQTPTTSSPYSAKCSRVSR